MKTINSTFEENEIIYVMDDDNKGIIRMLLEKSMNVLFISNLNVDMNYRCNGIGTKLLTYCINFAREKNFKCVTLEVDKNNQWLINWYSRHGFVTTTYGYTDDYYNNITMSKLI